MSEDAAVEALDELGLSTYEAQVFIGLQKLGAGSAREVAEVTDVPRSQVYGAADALAGYGLVDVQQADPTRFRPVDTDEARDRLVDRLESTADRAFDYIEEVTGEYADDDGERTEAIWTATGGETVAARARSLLDESSSRVVYGTSDLEYLEPGVAERLEAAAGRGVEVVVVSVNDAVGAAVEDVEGVRFQPIPPERDVEVGTGRLLVVDGDTMLLSVVPADAMSGVDSETAFWSADTALATVLVTIMDGWFGDLAAAYPR
jgi:sugar-specific transcriptional regulator TrmB